MATETATDRPLNDVRDLVGLLGHHADTTVLATSQGLQAAIAGRVFRSVPGSRPVQVVHDTVTSLVYTSVRVGLRAAATVGQLAAGAVAGDREVRWLDATPGRSAALSRLHGIVGDRFATDHPSLDLPVRIRVAGRDVPPTSAALATAFPAARPRVAVLVHGLTESELAWDQRRPPAGPDAPASVDLPDVLEDLGWSVVRLRYGTGRAVGRSGTELAELLETVVDVWPTEVEELCLVGHSMGGLVIRSAGAAGTSARHRWPRRVTHTVSLGTPHLGSWLERAANAGTRLLRHLPEGQVVAHLIDTRARGIKDLRYGALDDAAWGDGVVHPDGIGGLDEAIPAPTDDPPLLHGAIHHLVVGRLTASPDHPVTRLFGDLLVTRPSAAGDDGRRRLSGAPTEVVELAAGHFRLLHDPAVADHLRAWLA